MTAAQEGAPRAPETEAPQSAQEVRRSEVAALDELMRPAFDAINARAGSPGKTPQGVVPTGFIERDVVTGGGLAAASATAVFGNGRLAGVQTAPRSDL